MPRKRIGSSSVVQTRASVLLVGNSSAALERKQTMLSGSGFDITLAGDICHAELFAEAQYFDAAVYDESLSPQEQVSLARVMRVRWPWMRLVCCGSAARLVTEDAIFDATELSESQLASTLFQILN